jgi:hypothetical protein
MPALSPSDHASRRDRSARSTAGRCTACLAAALRLIATSVVAITLATACGGTRNGGDSGSSHSASGTSGAGAVASVTSSASSTSTAPPKPLPPATHTSCRSVVYIGDSTSDGEALAEFVPDRRLRAPAQLFKVGVKTTHMQVSGARSVYETFKGIPNGATVAQQEVSNGYHGCWVIALGTNDAADLAAGSTFGLRSRITRMMSIIGDQPVMWVNVLTIAGSPQFYEESGMRAWDNDLLAACDKYPMMRVYDWAAHAKPRWFIPDGVHYTQDGYIARTRLIAHALVKAFPRDRPPSANCVVQ